MRIVQGEDVGTVVTSSERSNAREEEDIMLEDLKKDATRAHAEMRADLQGRI